MRSDLDWLLRPLAQAKHARRRAAVRSRYALGSLLLLFATAALIVDEEHELIAAAALLAGGLVVIAYQLSRLARMPEAVSRAWLALAVECRLSAVGRAALTPLLMDGDVSCDAALEWALAERERPIDDMREAALCHELARP